VTLTIPLESTSFPLQLDTGGWSITSEGGEGIDLILNGRVVGRWNTRDLVGSPVPNGIYQALMEVKDSRGDPHILTARISLVRPGTDDRLVLEVRPSLITGEEDTCVLRATLDGSPVQGWRVKIYNVAGEQVRGLAVTDGQAVWDLRTGGGRSVSTGIYLLVAEGTDPASGTQLHGIRKILVLR